MSLGLINHCADQTDIEQDLFGLHFRSPFGVGSGLDYSGRTVDGLLDLGLGYVEVGNITPFIQHGASVRPRMFRSYEEGVYIDNSNNKNAGARLVDKYLESSYQAHKYFSKDPDARGVVGVSIGFSDHHDGSDPLRIVDEMNLGFERVMRNAAYVTVDLSQDMPLDRLHLEQMLSMILDTRKNAPEDFQLRPKTKQPYFIPTMSGLAKERRKEAVGRAAVLVKVSPDWTSEQHDYMAKLCLHLGVDGIEVADSTIQRPNSTADIYYRPGRMSGRANKHIHTTLIAQYYNILGHVMPIVSAGALDSGEEAYDKLRAGASLLHVNHTLIQNGPNKLLSIQKELQKELKKDGVTNIKSIIGLDAKQL